MITLRHLLAAAVSAATAFLPTGTALAEPGRPPVTIVTFGDSITAPRGTVLTYSTILRRELPKQGLNAVVVNAGVPGNTTVSARARFQKDVLDRKPHLVVILLGANDSMVDVWKKPPATASRVPVEQTEENLRYFVRTLREKGVQPILMNMIPMRWTDRLRELYGKPPYDPDDPMGLSVMVRKYQEVIRKVAREEKVPLVDLYSAFEKYGAKAGQSLDDLYLDGMHPNDRGHRLIADLLLPEIVARLKAPPQGD
jgi:lysophospholipase L1-like esterase